jgi:hypothetical protein
MFRTAIARNQARLFATSARQSKSATETAKEAGQAVHRAASNAALKGVEKGGMCNPFTSTPSISFI